MQSGLALLEAGEDVFTILGPGESIDFSHDLSAAYDFTVSGEGSYSVEAYDLFHYVDFSNNGLIPILAAGEAHLFMLSAQLSKARISSGLAAFHTFQDCDVPKRRILNRAVIDSRALVVASLAYLNNANGLGPLYRKWFGIRNNARYNTVNVIHENMRQMTHTFNCTPNVNGCANDNGNIRYGYVDPNQPAANQPVYICPQFWTLPATGVLSRASALVHETSHLHRIGNTNDRDYGAQYCDELARLQPNDAVLNADSYRLFSECVDARRDRVCDIRCSRAFCPSEVNSPSEN